MLNVSESKNERLLVKTYNREWCDTVEQLRNSINVLKRV